MTPAPSRDLPAFGPDEFRDAFGVSDTQMQLLESYAALLGKWQKAVNLVATDSLDVVWQRHFADSAQLLPLIPRGATCLDFGTGAGFPGMVIAMLSTSQDEAPAHLVESNARKCAFLRDVARQTATPVEIHNARIEEIAARGTVTQVDVIMARGVATLAKLLELSYPFFGRESVGLYLKGRRAEAEIDGARRGWVFDLRAHGSMTEPNGQILEIRALKRLEGERDG